MPSNPADNPRRPVTWIVVALLWAVFILATGAYFTQSRFGGYDFTAYDIAARAVINDSDLYTGMIGRVYLYPPLLAQVMAPLTTVLDRDGVGLVWYTLLMGGLISTLALLAPLVPRRWQPRLWLLPIAFYPFYESFFMGQVALLILLLVAGAWLACHRDQPELAGGLLAIATWVKVFPVVLLGYFLLRRDWRVVRGGLIIGLGLGALQLAISGVDTFGDFFDTLLTLAGDGQEGEFRSHAIMAFAARMFLETDGVQPLVISQPLYLITRYGLMLGMIGVSVWIVLRDRAPLQEYDARFDAEYGLFLLASMWVSSTLWLSGMPPLLLVFAIMMRQDTRLMRRAGWWAFGLISFVYPYLAFTFEAGALPWWSLSAGFAGMTVLWVAFVRTLLQESPQPQPESSPPAHTLEMQT